MTKVLPAILFLALTTAGCAVGGLRSRTEPAVRWPADLVGSWASTDPARTADTLVWSLGGRGRLRISRVTVRSRDGETVVRERPRSAALWWIRDPHSGDAGRQMCIAARAGRGYKCGRIVIDTLPAEGTSARRRLTWTGTTFKEQFSFVERKP